MAEEGRPARVTMVVFSLLPAALIAGAASQTDPRALDRAAIDTEAKRLMKREGLEA